MILLNSYGKRGNQYEPTHRLYDITSDSRLTLNHIIQRRLQPVSFYGGAAVSNECNQSGGIKMRDIKFRFYSNYDKEMQQLTLLDVTGGDFSPVYSGSFVPDELLGDGTRVQQIRDGHIMQYTGLFDKNGTEIYEGDIVKYTDHWSGQHFINEIYWKFGSLVFDVQYEDEKRYTVPIHSIHMDDDRGYEQTVEVIGNIHEHPELLEGRT